MKDRQIDRDRWIEIETKEAEEREREIVKEKQRKEGRIENGIKKKKNNHDKKGIRKKRIYRNKPPAQSLCP